jgi:outer membrane protein assembly factor BamD
MPLRLLCAISLFALLAGCATTAPVTKPAETYFREGEEYFAKKQYEDAIALLKKVKESYSSPELVAKAELKIADAQFENESYIEAASSYEDFRKFHPKHEKAAYALYRQAMCNYKQMGEVDTDQTPTKNAITLFESFLQQYPNDERAAEVRELLQACRTRLLQNEIYVGRFYLRTEKFRSAIKRLNEALALYPDSPLHDETLLYLGKAYILAGEREKGREVFNRLFKEFPASRYVDDARKFMEKNY